MWITEIISFGYLPAVFVAGHWLASNIFKTQLDEVPPLCRFAVYAAIGFLFWLPILFAFAALGAFSSTSIGALGWIVSVFRLPKLRTLPTFHRDNKLGILSTLALFVFYAAFSSESIQGGRDQGTYSLHAASILRTGELRADLPTEALADQENTYRKLLAISNPRGFHYDLANKEMIAQFPPSLALNLAQALGAGGLHGLTSVNPFLASLSALLFFALVRGFAPSNWALLSTIFFALNPAQLWNARITLSEILTQLIVLAGLLLAQICFAKGKDRAYATAIAILGLSSLIRIDCFLIATLVPFAHLAVLLGEQQQEQRKTIKRINKANTALAFATAISWAYYEYNTPAYFHEFTSKLSLFLLAGSLCWLISNLISYGPQTLRDSLGKAFFNKFSWITISGALIGTTLYALFLRPYIEPFTQFENSHYGTRNYQENSLLDLAAYISFPVIALALLATIQSFRQILEKRHLPLILLLSIWLGFSLAYLQDPRISPDHIWRIRRFTPIIIPGFILFATVFVSRYATKISSIKYATPLIWALGLGFVVYASKPIAFLKQYDGTYEMMSQINDAIPEGALIVTDVTSRIYSGLQLWYGRELMRGDFREEGHKELLEKLAIEARKQGRPTFLLSHKKLVNFTEESQAQHWLFRYPSLKGAHRAPARVVATVRFDFYLAQIDGKIKPFNGRETRIQLGNSIMIGVEEEGLHGVETHGPNTYRWTEGQALLKVKESFKNKFTYGTLKVSAAGPDGSQTKIRINGTQVLNTHVPRNGGDFQFRIPEEAYATEGIQVELLAETFNPHKRNPASKDKRDLGIKLSGIILSSEAEPSYGNLQIEAKSLDGIKENGLYEPEEDSKGLHRWTDGHAKFNFKSKEDFQYNKLSLSLSKSVLPETEFEILWNGKSIYKGSTSRKIREFEIPFTGIVPPSKEILLEIKSVAKTPQEIGINEDTRKLGLRITRIELQGNYPK